jgi:hypothetical protein
MKIPKFHPWGEDQTISGGQSPRFFYAQNKHNLCSFTLKNRLKKVGVSFRYMKNQDFAKMG